MQKERSAASARNSADRPLACAWAAEARRVSPPGGTRREKDGGERDEEGGGAGEGAIASSAWPRRGGAAPWGDLRRQPAARWRRRARRASLGHAQVDSLQAPLG